MPKFQKSAGHQAVFPKAKSPGNRPLLGFLLRGSGRRQASQTRNIVTPGASCKATCATLYFCCKGFSRLPLSCLKLEPIIAKLMKQSHPRGFTLVELLVSITIIVVLAAIIFTASSRAIRSADKAVAVQNMRGIGIAIQGFVMENNNRLPGPLNVGQSALFNGARPSLTTYIAKYMEEPRDSEIPYLVANFASPALMKKFNKNQKDAPIVYRMGSDGVENIRGEKGFPWIWNNPAGTTARPWRLDEINPRSAARNYAMIEQDATMGGTWTNNGASAPSFGNERMALMFDWSVKAQKVGEWRK